MLKNWVLLRSGGAFKRMNRKHGTLILFPWWCWCCISGWTWTRRRPHYARPDALEKRLINGRNSTVIRLNCSWKCVSNFRSVRQCHWLAWPCVRVVHCTISACYPLRCWFGRTFPPPSVYQLRLIWLLQKKVWWTL